MKPNLKKWGERKLTATALVVNPSALRGPDFRAWFTLPSDLTAKILAFLSEPIEIFTQKLKTKQLISARK